MTFIVEKLWPDRQAWIEKMAGAPGFITHAEELAGIITQFVQALADAGLSKGVIKTHLGNMDVLSNDAMRRLHASGDLESTGYHSISQMLRNMVSEEGGPVIHWMDEARQKSFNSTCRKLNHFFLRRLREKAAA